MSQSSDAPNGKPGDLAGALSDADIALLCDIGGTAPLDADADKMRRLARLVAEGFLEPARATQAPAKYQLTAKAQKLLTERGVGLNEA